MAPSAPKPDELPEEVVKGIKKLEQQKLQLQTQANKQTQQEMTLLRQQIEANNRQAEAQLGLFRNQIANTDQAMSEYKTQLGLISNLQEAQLGRQYQDLTHAWNEQNLAREKIAIQQTRGRKRLDQRRSSLFQPRTGVYTSV